MLQIIILSTAGYGGESHSIFDDIIRTGHGRIFDMENEDIEILQNHIGDEFKSANQKLPVKRMAITDSAAENWLPTVRISTTNISSIVEEEPLAITCTVNTSESATVLLKHNDEIIHQWHIP